MSKRIYQIAENIRVEKIGSDNFKGIKKNLSYYFEERTKDNDHKNSTIEEKFEYYLRLNIFKDKIQRLENWIVFTRNLSFKSKQGIILGKSI